MHIKFLRFGVTALLGMILPLNLAAQLVFHPPVEFYGKETYRADAQNWAVAPGRTGELFVGNAQGLLHYNGYRWELRRLPDGSPVYSLLVDGERVYTGGVHNFGYWSSGGDGALHYTSLSDEVKKSGLGFDDIQTILKCGDKIVFHAFNALHVYDGTEVRSQRYPDFIMSPQVMEDGGILVWKRGQGIDVLDVTGIEGVASHDFPTAPFRSPLAALVPDGDGTYYACTYRDGIFHLQGDAFVPFPTEADALLRSLIVRHALRDEHTGDLIVATHLGGVLRLSAEGKLRWRLGGQDDLLPGNQVFGMQTDDAGNLWLATERGIARVLLDAPVMQSTELDASMGILNTAAYQAPYLYLGTSLGLFRGRFSADFQRLDELVRIDTPTKNILELSLVDGQLFCSTNGPTYEILADRVLPACPVTGGAEMEQGIMHGRNVLIQHTFSGLCVYLKEDGRWRYSHQLEGVPGPVRGALIDSDGSLWVKVLYGSLWRLQLDDQLRTVISQTEFEGLGASNAPSEGLFRFGRRVLFSDGESGLYAYDDLQNRMVPYQRLEKWSSVLSIDPLSRNDYAFALPEGTVFVHDSGDSLVVRRRLSQHILGGTTPDVVSRVVPLPGERYLFLRENTISICKLDGTGSDIGRAGELSLSRLTAHNYEVRQDSLFRLDGSRIRIPWRYHSITLQYAIPRFGLSYQPRFRIRFSVSGETHAPEELGTVPEITLSHLREGHYSVTAEALSLEGDVLSSYTHSFDVLPPWRRSILAIALYILLALSFLMLVMLTWHRRRRTREYQLKAEQHEAEVRALNADLTARIIDNTKWNDALRRIKEQLTQQKERLGKDYPDKDYRAVCALIDREMKGESEWSFLSQSIDKAHDNFLHRLQERYPELTETDLRYCAYIRMNMSNKETAEVMNITVRGAEAARYRIKKKLGLTAEQSLETFLKAF